MKANKTVLFRLVLVEEIHIYEEKGWRRKDDKIHVKVGGWPSVWMRKEEK